jgi:hypothetical protein
MALSQPGHAASPGPESAVRNLAFYVVPGHVTSAAPVVREVALAWLRRMTT